MRNQPCKLYRPAALSLILLFALASPAQAGLGKMWEKVRNSTAHAYSSCANYCQKKIDKAREDQAKLWGLKLPGDFNPDKPLTILIHGLDSNDGIWNSMAPLLREAGFQVAFFNYPCNGEIDHSANRLADAMADLHAKHPKSRVNLLTHSMGGLVARCYLEGGRYTQPVDRFIAIAPPNHGSAWARWHLPMKINEHYWLRKTYKEWSPLWVVTDGTGAAKQLLPGSAFLKELNSRPRRQGVRYTILVGDQHLCWRKTAESVEAAEAVFSKNLWGLRHTARGLENMESWLRKQSGAGDGAVSIESAQLDGVTDIVKLPADHNSIVMSRGPHQAPVSWDAIRERLAK